MIAAAPDRLLVELRRLGETLSATYPYAAMIGRWLAADEPGLWQQFAIEQPPQAALAMAQARHYAFLAWAEADLSRRDVVDNHAARYLAEGGRELRAELANTVAWYSR
jgi:hypothetical protein